MKEMKKAQKENEGKTKIKRNIIKEWKRERERERERERRKEAGQREQVACFLFCFPGGSLVSDWMNERLNEWVNEWVSVWMTERVSDEWLNDWVSDLSVIQSSGPRGHMNEDRSEHCASLSRSLRPRSHDNMISGFTPVCVCVCMGAEYPRGYGVILP